MGFFSSCERHIRTYRDIHVMTTAAVITGGGSPARRPGRRMEGERREGRTSVPCPGQTTKTVDHCAPCQRPVNSRSSMKWSHGWRGQNVDCEQVAALSKGCIGSQTPPLPHHIVPIAPAAPVAQPPNWIPIPRRGGGLV